MRVARYIVAGVAFVILPFAPLQATAGGSVALILDASGSMNARLPEGKTRIEAAKLAVADLVGKLPADIRLSLWAYGHQSPTSKHDCRDTQRIVAFDAIGANKESVVAKTLGIKAQGYTPITYVIKLVADDLAKEDAKPRTIILVSDGKETCEGDPLRHREGTGGSRRFPGRAYNRVRGRYRRQSISFNAWRAWRAGRYFDAGSTSELAAMLSEAAKPVPPPQTVTQIVVTKPQPGRLEVRRADMKGHKVSSAETGEIVASLNSSGPRKELPAGLYNVTFGNAVWKSVEVKARRDHGARSRRD